MLIIKDEYSWMSTDEIIEQFTNEELHDFYDQLISIRSNYIVSKDKLPEILKKMVLNEKSRYPYISDALNLIDTITTAEIIFRFKEKKF